MEISWGTLGGIVEYKEVGIHGRFASSMAYDAFMKVLSYFEICFAKIGVSECHLQPSLFIGTFIFDFYIIYIIWYIAEFSAPLNKCKISLF